jgi:hypothetical protein
MLLKLIACEVFYREMCAAVARSPNQVDMEFLPKGLHDIGSVEMLRRLQAVVDRVDGSKHEAVLLGYGLCNNGVVGLRARSVPLVIPRAHDCITLFLGSRERYRECFDSLPGAYFKTSGWIERGEVADELKPLSISHKHGMNLSYEELVEKYGESNARFLQETLCDTTRNYDTLAFIEMGLEPESLFEQQVRDEAASRNWKFRKLQGDMSLLRRLIDGDWNDGEFLVVPAGGCVQPTYNEDIITSADGTDDMTET